MAKQPASNAARRGSPTEAAPRFTGSVGRRRLVERLRSQTLISGDAALARALQKAGLLTEFAKGDVVIEQGANDNDILLIVQGVVSVLVNGRKVASREAGTHVGEMALVDMTARRSATVVADEPTVALKVPEHKFSKVATAHPDLWRRIAVEIANRLKERNRFFPPIHNEPVLFIGSSSEGLAIVDAIHATFTRRRIVPRPWTNDVFQASSTAIESLMRLTAQADFAALVLTADDVTLSRGRVRSSPRDNVIFELGLLMGALGRERVFILKPRSVDIRIPSDLLGITWLDYQRAGPTSWRQRLQSACARISARIADLGPK